MTLRTTPFDAAAYLDSAEAIAEFMTDALETQDAAYITHALGVVARAKGMTDLAKEVGVSRQSLYKSLSDDGHPEFGTVVKVLSILGVGLKAEPRQAQPTGDEVREYA